MVKNAIAAYLSDIHPDFSEYRFPLTKHMYAYWHRFNWKERFHLNSERSRLNYIVFYIWESIGSRDVNLYLDNKKILGALNAPVETWGTMTTFWHMVWSTHFRGQFDVYTEDGYYAFLSHVAANEVSWRKVPRVLMPAQMLEALNLPQPHLPFPGITRINYHVWNESPFYRQHYHIHEDPVDRDMFMLDQIIHAIGERDLGFLLSPEEARYWGQSPNAQWPSLSRMVMLMAGISMRFGEKLSKGILDDEMVEAIESWWKTEVALDLPCVLQFAPNLTPQNFNLSNQEIYALGAAKKWTRIPDPDQANGEIDILVIGPMGASSGLGAGMRRLVGALERTGANYRVQPFFYDMPSNVQFADLGKRTYKGEVPRQVIWHYNAEYIYDVMSSLPKLATIGYNIGYFFWETEAIPDAHLIALEVIDEVWVPSEFCRSTYADRGIPVVNVGSSVELPKFDRFFSRAELGLDETSFVVMFSFDSFSVIHRKNPSAVIRAFKQAFPEGTENVSLVIKTQNMSHAHWNWVRGRGEELLELVSSDPRIIFFDKTMTLQELYSLKVASNAYISLHRSEGYGYGPAEAMALGRPVIMSRYSSTGEFESGENCILIDGPLVHVHSDEYLYQVPEMVWADPSVADAAKALRRLYDDPDYAQRIGQAAADTLNREQGVEAMAARIRKRLEQLLDTGRKAN